MAGRTQGWSTATTRIDLPLASMRPVMIPALGPRPPARVSGIDRTPWIACRPATTTSGTTCDSAV